MAERLNNHFQFLDVPRVDPKKKDIEQHIRTATGQANLSLQRVEQWQMSTCRRKRENERDTA